jgi:uncharacterized protein YdeI (YjbR/CyaY-like superfamily)
MGLVFFPKQSDFRKWLEKNHERKKELLVGFYKVSSGKPSITWSQSVDEALCFGWIDGIRKSVDEDSYCIRFTPRKVKSIWSAINIKRVEELTRKGLMRSAGLEIFNKRVENKSRIYSFENRPKKLNRVFENQFKAEKKAWSQFLSMPPSYQKTAIFWVMSAKQDATRQKRLDTLIKDSNAGQKIKPLSYGVKKN